MREERLIGVFCLGEWELRLVEGYGLILKWDLRRLSEGLECEGLVAC